MLILERHWVDDKEKVTGSAPLAVSESLDKLKMYNQFTGKAAWEQEGESLWRTPKVGLGYWEIRWILTLDNLR